jgi:glucosamine--fructose-6-phosphate aminotransferase (isomerizing)
VVVLGGGARLGIAREACLKIIETSQLDASAYEPLEFRHGPISVCEPGTLVVGLLGDSAAEDERRVVEECAALGATIWMPDPGAELHPLIRLPLLMPPLQALAVGIAVRRGRDPDRPRHLAQVVVLP